MSCDLPDTLRATIILVWLRVMYRVILHAMCPIHDAQLILVCKVARDVSGDIACDVPDT